MRDYISKKVKDMPHAGIKDFLDVLATMKDVISLGIGEPNFPTPQPIREAGLDSIQKGRTGYTSFLGLIELRREICSHLKKLYGVTFDPETEVMITIGVSEALHLALNAIVNPGDEVIVPEPSFGAYKAGVILAGGKPVVIPTTFENGFQITAEQIKKRITDKTKALLLGYPNNPTGAVMNLERLEEIVELVERHDLVIVSDEIYDRLVYDARHTCLSSMARERTILLQGFSKSYAMTGWRVGYVASPKEMLEAMHKIHGYLIMTAPTMSQYAAIEALRQGERHVQEMIDQYDKRRRLIYGGLEEIGLPCVEPHGAFYAFPSIKHLGMTSYEFSRRLLFEEKVAVIPGSAFGESGEGFIRCSYVASMEDIQKALERMERFVKRHD